jgi:uncharacterized protein (DUF934 family)
MRFIEPRRNPWRSLSGEDGPVVGIQPVAHLLLDLTQWHAFRAQWPEGMPVGVALGNDVDVEELAPDLPRLALIALNFPKWVDGRAYSQAHLLRARLRFGGEIRATGEVLVDMLPLLKRTGFDAVVLRPDQSEEAARRALGFFPGHYQGALDDPQPLFAKPPGTAEALVRKAVPEFVSAGEGI